MSEEIMVSICCITYNHENYIRQALDSFLMQKTNFKYEIIIRDDASTDNTANIIREYESNYPELIKPIYEKENGYQRNIKALPITFDKAMGKYIAVCEGDDYWTSEEKLQKQVDYMEKNKECTFCFHNAFVWNMNTNKSKKFIRKNNKYIKANSQYNMGELELLNFIPTASFMFRRENLNKVPDWYRNSFIGDLPLKLIMTSFGYAYYIDEIMSVYRTGTGHSATDKLRNDTQKDINKNLQFCDGVEEILDNMNKFTGNQYNAAIQTSKRRIEINKCLVKKEYRQIMKNKEYWKLVTLKDKIKILMNQYFPTAFLTLKKVFKKG